MALHIDRVSRIDRALRQLNLEVFWVDPQGRVAREGIWQGNSKWLRNTAAVASAKGSAARAGRSQPRREALADQERSIRGGICAPSD